MKSWKGIIPIIIAAYVIKLIWGLINKSFSVNAELTGIVLFIAVPLAVIGIVLYNRTLRSNNEEKFFEKVDSLITQGKTIDAALLLINKEKLWESKEYSSPSKDHIINIKELKTIISKIQSAFELSELVFSFEMINDNIIKMIAFYSDSSNLSWATNTVKRDKIQQVDCLLKNIQIERTKLHQLNISNDQLTNDFESKQDNLSKENTGCVKCGCCNFEHDSYYDEYNCENCGWISKQKPLGVVNIKELSNKSGKVGISV